MRHKAVFLCAAFIALAVGFVAYQYRIPVPQKEQQVLHRFTLPDVSGVVHDIDQWKGKVLVINFWATWCPPCLEEIPEFIRLQQSMGSKGLQFIGIAVDDAGPVEDFMATLKINYPVLIAGPEGTNLSVRFGNTLRIVPFSIVVDRTGRIRHSHHGVFRPDQVRDKVAPFL